MNSLLMWNERQSTLIGNSFNMKRIAHQKRRSSRLVNGQVRTCVCESRSVENDGYLRPSPLSYFRLLLGNVTASAAHNFTIIIWLYKNVFMNDTSKTQGQSYFLSAKVRVKFGDTNYQHCTVFPAVPRCPQLYICFGKPILVLVRICLYVERGKNNPA